MIRPTDLTLHYGPFRAFGAVSGHQGLDVVRPVARGMQTTLPLGLDARSAETVVCIEDDPEM